MLLTALSTLLFLFSPTVLATTVDANTLLNLEVFARYAGAAYCPSNYISTSSSTVTFPAPLSGGDEAEIVRSFIGVRKHQTAGLVMLDHGRKLVVIAFRGTTDSVDWQTDLDFPRSRANDVCPGCNIHSGFLDSWRAVRNIVFGAWTNLQSQYPGYDTVVSGHSLGGALAHVCAANLKHAHPKATISLITYASPRVGGQGFASYIDAAFGSNNYRVTHLNDPVPRLPGQLLGFVHTSPEYHITSPHIPGALDANKTVLLEPANLVPGPRDILVLPGPESDKGNDGYHCTDVAMHDAYFVDVAGCIANESTPILEDFVVDICAVFLMCCISGLDFGILPKEQFISS